MKNRTVRGSLFIWDDEPQIITGYLVVGEDHYEVAGVRKSRIRIDLTGQEIDVEASTKGDRKRDLA